MLHIKWYMVYNVWYMMHVVSYMIIKLYPLHFVSHAMFCMPHVKKKMLQAMFNMIHTFYMLHAAGLILHVAR